VPPKDLATENEKLKGEIYLLARRNADLTVVADLIGNLVAQTDFTTFVERFLESLFMLLGGRPSLYLIKEGSNWIEYTLNARLKVEKEILSHCGSQWLLQLPNFPSYSWVRPPANETANSEDVKDVEIFLEADESVENLLSFSQNQEGYNILIVVTNLPQPDYLSTYAKEIADIINPLILSLRYAKIHEETIAQKNQLEQVNESLSQEISRRTDMEHQLRQTLAELERSNLDLEEFARIVSHDLQEPLRTISSFVQLLQRRYDAQLDEKANEYITFVIDGTKRMQMLIQDLLMYSRATRQVEPFQPTDCEAVLEQTLLDLQATIAESNAVVTHDPLPTVVAIKEKLGEVFQNLISNAIKYRKPDDDPVIHVSAEQGEQEWTFSVRDNGIGIDPGQYKRLFHLFQRLQKNNHVPGTGIGLATCKKIIDTFGGRIWVESEVGNGSTFFFTIPIQADQ
ncbi:MAG TPA: ATP-binding protein, partial [Candidatus Lokiarchaeia archaeon]|nr:ATP-binding protein [Candidatus Lokiarchaeia archaeon]